METQIKVNKKGETSQSFAFYYLIPIIIGLYNEPWMQPLIFPLPLLALQD